MYQPSYHSQKALHQAPAWLLGVTLSLLAVALAAAQEAAVAPPLVFDGATVIDVKTGKLLPGQRVIIEGRHIKTMGAAAKTPLPPGAQVVDAKGKYLIPGLWDLHTHSRTLTHVFYPLFIANGITGIRDGWSEVPLDTLIRWRNEILAGSRIGPPRQILVGAALDESKPCNRTSLAGHICVADSADARRVVQELKTAGADMIKVYKLSREMYFVVAAEANRLGLPVGGHVGSMSAAEASDSWINILDHVNTAADLATVCWGWGARKVACDLLAEKFRNNDSWFTPTLTRLRDVGLDTGPHAKEVFDRFAKRMQAFWSASGTIADATVVADDDPSGTGKGLNYPGYMDVIDSVGLPILAATDAGAPVLKKVTPGFSLHTELEMYVSEGLSPLHTLQSATLNPAKLMHATDSLGTVAPGKLADLVLLDANPLTKITNTTKIRAVVANGRYYDRAELDRLITKARADGRGEQLPADDKDP